MPVKLSPRLATAVLYVRPGHLVADIGTDHAYLPIFLCETGILPPRADGRPSAIAADINRGPVERAAIHIAAAGLADRIRTVQTDGLHGLDTPHTEPDDILIFGMGGELMVSILAAAPWVAREGKRLILQPMTHAEKVRGYLAATGWTVIGETLSREGDRIYQTLSAERDGSPATPMSPAELAVGRDTGRSGDDEQRALYVALIDRTIKTETPARDARAAAGQDTAASDALLRSLADLRASIT